MDMVAYITEIQRRLITEYGFAEDPEKPGLPLQVRDGQYPMRIEGRLDFVRIKNGTIRCCNFEASVGEMRQQAAFQDANTPVVIVAKDEELKRLLGNRVLRTVRTYPDTTDGSGDRYSSFKVEVKLSKF